MDDKEIIDQFWARSESAIKVISDKYSKYCRTIAFNILGNVEDTEEVLNDTYHRAWNAIPPETYSFYRKPNKPNRAGDALWRVPCY